MGVHRGAISKASYTVLCPIALQIIEFVHDLVANPLTVREIKR
jgi:hypothetical protein